MTSWEIGVAVWLILGLLGGALEVARMNTEYPEFAWDMRWVMAGFVALALWSGPVGLLWAWIPKGPAGRTPFRLSALRWPSETVSKAAFEARYAPLSWEERRGA